MVAMVVSRIGFAMLLVACAALSGCLELVAAALAPQATATAVAGQTVANAASNMSSVSAANMSAETTTLSDVDRVMSELPADSPQRADLADMRDQLASQSTHQTVHATHRFVSDPRRDIDGDHRSEDADRPPSRDAFLAIASTRTDPGHKLLRDPPRRLGLDDIGRRDQAKPFHVARSSDLDPWEPRFYGNSMPSLPTQPGRHDSAD